MRSFVLAALVLACAVGSAVFFLSASASGRKPQAPATPAATFTVTTTADDGAGSLRNAITQANVSPGADLITFDIGVGTPSIPVGSLGLGPLPVITEAVTIDGATGGATRVELDGTPAGGDGLFITSGNCIIRGLVINRFSGSGIVLSTNGTNVLQNSFIGTDSTGTASLGNLSDAGVLIDDSPNNSIGGTTPGAGNLISGNALTGVQIQNPGATNNMVQGNLIGTDISGTTPLGNVGDGGVRINGSPNNLIGGTNPGSGNLISANAVGVWIFNPGATNNMVQGNLIGTDINGTAALANAEHGVLIDSGAANNTIGGASAAARNIISGNGGSGVRIGSATAKIAGDNGNLVQGNFIGTDINGVLPLGNNGEGVSILGSVAGTPAGNTIGGTIPGASNTIAFNTGSGVLIEDGTMNAVLSNSIFSNQLLGINLSDDAGITPNDPCDGDVGANNLQNLPDLTSASSDGGNTTIQGALNSTASAQFRIEFFSNPACDLSGNGEGASFLGFTLATTGPGCLAAFNVNLPVAVAVGAFITATATDLLGNTSEFSACVQVTGGGCTILCPSNIMLSNDPGACGAIATYPPPTTTGMCGSITCTPPSGSFFGTGQTNVICTTGAGPGCSFTITVNDTQSPVITCPANQTTTATVPGGATVTYPSPTVTDNCAGASAACVPPSGSLFPVGVTTVNCAGTDASSNSTFCGFTVTVTAQADLSVTKSGSPNPVASGGNLTYVITINNAGPSSATGVTVTDAVPAGTTFVSVTTSQGTSTAPPPGGTGNVTCSLGTILLGGSANVTLVVNVNAAPGATISNTVVVSSTSNDPVSGNNSSSEATPVVFLPCAINCPTDVVANTLPSPFNCGAAVSYPVPTTTGPCGGVICTPPSSSFFPLGVTLVSCATAGGPSCSFSVTVKDTIPPRITCSGNISTSAALGGNLLVVKYSSPVVVDNCSTGTAVCTPPSGSSFSLGTSMVTCTAQDAAGNIATCSFSITVIDNQAPTITCPPPVVVEAAAQQCAATVNYPPPMVADLGPGTTVVCAPPSGSTYPVGTTTVGCTATDAFGNRSTCTFAVTVEQSPLAFPGDVLFVAFGLQTRVPPVRKPKKNPPSNCDCFGTFAITNTGCAVLGLNLASISRVGSDVATGRITNPDDTKFFALRIVNANGSERPVPQLCGDFCIEIAPGQSQTFRVVFSPLIPAPSGKTSGLAARSVLPDNFDSTIIFDTNRGSTLSVSLLSRVGTALQLINAANPKKPASVSFVRSGDEFILTYAVFDANLDTTRAEYEMLDRSGAIVGQAIEVDLTQPIVDGQVFKGQSFIVSQRFSGATDNPQITSVRFTVFDGEASVSITRQLEVSASAARLLPNRRVAPATIHPRLVKLVSKAP